MDETVPSGLQNLMRREGRKPLFRFVAALTAEYRDNRLLDMLTVLFTERRSALEKEEILYERFGMENTIPVSYTHLEERCAGRAYLRR